jgi:hypothetical protein
MRPRLWGWGTGAARCPSETNDGVWFDEEPPMEIYTEGLTRTDNGQRNQFRHNDVHATVGCVRRGSHVPR